MIQQEPGESYDVVVIGAGPAGLCAALGVAWEGLSVAVLEADPERVGGISRTVEHRGWRFDIGGHRFFSRSEEVNRLWRRLLPDDMLERPRTSRIFHRGRFYSYPLDPVQALRNLGPVEGFLCVASFLLARFRPVRDPRTFEEWVTNAFGSRLYRTFFKTYSEKVWGVPCSSISADWAAQRIKGLDLGVALLHALKGVLGGARVRPGPKTLINSFLYPRLGPGMMWKAAAAELARSGGRTFMGRRATALSRAGDAWTVLADTGETFRARHVVSTTDMRALSAMLPDDPGAVDDAEALTYRDYVLVALAFDREPFFPDNWLYVHDPDVATGRIQNFGSWSPDMLARPGSCCLGFEYFCGEGDATWSASDEDLVALALADLAKLGFSHGVRPVESAVVRQSKAYPVYLPGFRDRVERLRRRWEDAYPTLHLAGRNGMHRYNNQDHAMATGLIVARNVVAGRRVADPWRVNDDAEYVEGDGEVAATYAPPEPLAAPAAGLA